MADHFWNTCIYTTLPHDLFTLRVYLSVIYWKMNIEVKFFLTDMLFIVYCFYQNYTICQDNTWTPRQNGCHFTEDISKNIFVNANVWVSIKIDLQQRVQITITKHWFRHWLGAGEATSQYPDQWCHSLMTHMCVTWPECVYVQVDDS